jgi:adenine phosphoribosyltransferase
VLASDETERLLWSRIRDVPDWPQPGVMFRDLTPLMADPVTFTAAIDLLAGALDGPIDEIVGIEARGFPYGAALAYRLGAGFVTLRKPGKLPGNVHSKSYDLEYGSTSLEMHQDALAPGRRIVIVDDVLATGGTASAAIDLIEITGATIVTLAVVLDLVALGGGDVVRERGVDVTALLTA